MVFFLMHATAFTPMQSCAKCLTQLISEIKVSPGTDPLRTDIKSYWLTSDLFTLQTASPPSPDSPHTDACQQLVDVRASKISTSISKHSISSFTIRQSHLTFIQSQASSCYVFIYRAPNRIHFEITLLQQVWGEDHSLWYMKKEKR